MLRVDGGWGMERTCLLEKGELECSNFGNGLGRRKKEWRERVY